MPRRQVHHSNHNMVRLLPGMSFNIPPADYSPLVSKLGVDRFCRQVLGRVRQLRLPTYPRYEQLRKQERLKHLRHLLNHRTSYRSATYSTLHGNTYSSVVIPFHINSSTFSHLVSLQDRSSIPYHPRLTDLNSLWHNDQMLLKAIRHLVEKNYSLSHRRLFNYLDMNGRAGVFRSFSIPAAQWLIKLAWNRGTRLHRHHHSILHSDKRHSSCPLLVATQKNTRKDEMQGGCRLKMVDFCGGWSDRLLAAMTSSHLVSHYTGIDPSHRAAGIYQRVRDKIQPEIYATSGHPPLHSEWIRDAAEKRMPRPDFVAAHLGTSLILTSPPFWNMERYEHDDGDLKSLKLQTWHSYSTDQAFVHDFLRPVVQASMKILCPTCGLLAINLDGTSDQMKLFFAMCQQEGLRLAFQTAIQKKTRPTRFYSKHNHNHSRADPIWVFIVPSNPE